MKPIILFEYEKRSYADIPFLAEEKDERIPFKRALQQIWDGRKVYGLKGFYESDSSESEQKFFTFYDEHLKAGKYVGAIRYKGYTILVLPKILEGRIKRKQAAKLFNFNLLWWLSWSSKINFPKSFNSVGSIEFDILEILVFLFATLTRDDLVYNKHLSYQEQEETLLAVRGRIDFAKYSVNYATSNPHIVPCIYDSLEIDNDYNRAIKYTARFLLLKTEQESIRNLLHEIIWILDDVSDVYTTAVDCERITVSPLKPVMKMVLNYCMLFLSGTSVSNDLDDYEVFSFLLPMEVVFEDFVYQFIRNTFENTGGFGEILEQGGMETTHLAEENIKGKVNQRFRLKPDIYLENSIKGNVIADTKYKKIYSKSEADESDRLNSGAASNDVYQMLAYAVKFEVNRLHLLYPQKIDDSEDLQSEYIIDREDSSLVNDINIQYHRLPSLIENASDNDHFDLDQAIVNQEELLRKKLSSLLIEISNE